MARRVVVFSGATARLCVALGTEISVARRERRWSQSELAERIGMSLGTVRAIEKGTPSVSLGAAFEAATVLGIDLFGGADAVAARAANNRRTLQLLPQRVRNVTIDDDF